jgi:hypothetical protein
LYESIISLEVGNEDAIPFDLLAHEGYDRLLFEGLAARQLLEVLLVESGLAFVQDLAQVLAEGRVVDVGHLQVAGLRS